MGYLSEYEHDIFVSYAHSELNDWSKRLVQDTRKLVATGLGLRQATQVDLWMDYKICGNQPLTKQLREKVEGAGVLLVLMSDWYLDSAWCRDERDWFVNTVRQRGADRVFVVRVCTTDHDRWPKSFKDEHGHPLVGYDFVHEADDHDLRLPKGHPRPEDASDSKEYYDALRKLARDIVNQLKAIERAKLAPPDDPSPPHGLREQEEVVFLAAVPEELDELRDELAGLLRESGCVVVPDTNPLDFDEVHGRAPEWVSNCNKFVQVLGKHIGRWPYDSAGLVMYQHDLARKSNKPIYVYRAPAVDVSAIKHPAYRSFLEGFDQDDTGGLQSFAERVALKLSNGNDDFNQNVFMMAGPRDKVLEQEIRRLMEDLDISVFPVTQSSEDARDVSSIIDEQGFLDVLKRCGAIVLLAGHVKSSHDFWLDRTILYMEQDIKRKLGALPPYAVIDAPPPPPINASKRMSVLLKDSPSFKDELQSWLRRSTHLLSAPKQAAAGFAQGNLN